MSRLVHIALVQFDSIINKPKENTDRAISFIETAAKDGANIICFPELFSTGYHIDLVGPNLKEVAEDLNGPIISALRKAAKDNGCYVIAPIALKKETPGIYYNSAVVIGDNGCIIGVYDKHHACFDEGKCYKDGYDIPVFETKYGTIGIMICYDMGFPEIARILTLKGAELIFVPSAWCEQDADMWNIQVPARGLENLVFVAANNRCGTEGETHFFGNSKVVNWRGKVLSESESDKEEIIHAVVDLDELVPARETIKYLKDRRPESYGVITEA